VDYIYLKKKQIQKFSRKSFQKIVIFSNIFLPILHNIELYIYTVKYKSGIKIPGFLRNISKKIFKTLKKKISKTFKLIFPFKNKKKYFHAYDQILKFFQAYLHKNKDCIFFHVLKCKMDIVTSL
jgi:hypothetical protein